MDKYVFITIIMVNFSIFIAVRWIFVTKLYPKVMNKLIEEKFEAQKKLNEVKNNEKNEKNV